MRLALFILAVMWLVNCRAQRLFSFEPDSIGTTDWQKSGGRCGISNLKMVGLIPFTATAGNYFMTIENDSAASQPKGSISATFALTEIPQSLSYDYFYLPALAKQVGLLQFRFYLSGAEIAGGFDTIIPVFSGIDTIQLKWQERQLNLPPLTQLPDSCKLQWWADETTPYSSNPLLLLDNLQWSKWKVGVVGVKENILKIFPNPANTSFTIEIPDRDLVTICIKNLSGQLIVRWENPEPGKPLDIETICSGMYIIECSTADNLFFTQKLVVCK